jgi:hypothetical protein
MFTRQIYRWLIMFVIFLKITYFCIAISYRICEIFKIDEKKIAYLKLFRDNTLIVSEFFMYVIIIILFFPSYKPKDIHIDREEQIIIFMLGVLGMIHTNLESFKSFIIDVKQIPINI